MKSPFPLNRENCVIIPNELASFSGEKKVYSDPCRVKCRMLNLGYRFKSAGNLLTRLDPRPSIGNSRAPRDDSSSVLILKTVYRRRGLAWF